MATVFVLLFTVSIIGLIVGLIKPSFVKLKLRKHVAYIFGGAIVVFFMAVGITAPSMPSDNSVVISKVQTATLAPAQSTTTVVTSSLSSATSSESNPFSDPKQNDSLFISQWSGVNADFQYAGSDLVTAGNAIDDKNYSLAINAMQSVQYDLQGAQTGLSAAVFGPLTPDVANINTIANQAVTSGLKGTGIAITDMKNANYGAVNSVALPYLTTMSTDYNKVQELVAGWEAKNQ
jgi:hypothetical protein